MNRSSINGDVDTFSSHVINPEKVDENCHNVRNN
jgi:hypothetical protein